MNAEKKIYCNKCKCETRHTLLTESKKDFYNDIDLIHYWDIYQIKQCSGCEEVSFCHISGDNENHDSGTCEQIELERCTFYPERNSDKLEIRNRPFLPEKIGILYRETIIAFNNNCNILCMIWLRSIVEAICDKEDIERNRINSKGEEVYICLKDRIEKLIKKHTVAEILDKHRELWNDSTHRFTEHSNSILLLAIGSLDNILNALYENKEISANLTINES